MNRKIREKRYPGNYDNNIDNNKKKNTKHLQNMKK